MKKVFGVLALVATLLGVLPSQAFAAPTWIDVDGQVSPAPYEHYVFYRGYYYAMYPDDPVKKKGIRWNADSLIWSYTYNAMATWNASRPAGIEAMIEEPVANNADLRLSYTACPGIPSAAGCYTVNSWYTATTFGARFWKKSTIYIRYGSDWTTNSLTGVLRHEIGHALGFQDQYSGWIGCNPLYWGLMDSGFHNGQGYWQNCDMETPSQAEINSWTSFHMAGLYTWNAQAFNSQGALRIQWLDNAWNDATQHVMYRKSNVANGTYTDFAQSYHTGNGTHNDVTWPYLEYLIDETYPYQFGANNTWIKVCREPIFNHYGNLGNLTCGPPIYYHYP